LDFELYKWLGMKLMCSKNVKYAFVHLFLLCCWGLMCRAGNVVGVNMFGTCTQIRSTQRFASSPGWRFGGACTLWDMFGITPEMLGTHSNRKGAATYLAGLACDSPDFAILPPFFKPETEEEVELIRKHVRTCFPV